MFMENGKRFRRKGIKMKQKSIDMMKQDMKHLIFYIENFIREEKKTYIRDSKYILKELKRMNENLK